MAGIALLAGCSTREATARTGPALSPVAEIGRAIFFDRRLSASGTLACASCHSPAHAYGPPGGRSVQLGGPSGHDQGGRAVPSLRYLDRVPAFSIGPDNPESERGMLTATAARAARAAGAQRAAKTAGAGGAPSLVPRGGLFWDGRANTLQAQALAPLVNPVEMANVDAGSVAAKLARFGYAERLSAIFGAETVSTPPRLLDEALFAVARYQLEDPSFHPYSSKYDRYLAGEAMLSPAELRGLRAFEDPARGNCAACHLDRPGPEGRPPMFSDYQYEALGVPRNDSLAANRQPAYHDLGLCGPVRTDLAGQRGYCGMFRTPSLRNVATRGAFFHNGLYHTLAQVLRFYDFRDTRPELVYPRDAAGRVVKFNDLPAALRRNVDTVDAPLNRKRGDAPAMSEQDMADIIAFLETLTDGHRGAP